MIHFKLKQVAQTKGISQHRLIKESGLDERTIRRIWQDKPGLVVTTDTLDRLASFLDVPVTDLLESVRPALE